jgi:hypothetical protein
MQGTGCYGGRTGSVESRLGYVVQQFRDTVKDLVMCLLTYSSWTDLSNSILVVRRGNCTFLEKAMEADRQRARALVIVNIEDRIESPSSGLGIEPGISEAVVVGLNNRLTLISVANTTWETFLFHDKLAAWTNTVSGGDVEAIKPTAQIVPLKCVPGGKCSPLIAEG